ncbi:MAG: acetylornithine/succinyldiaminopimelate transaminase [Pseudomonadota bacterium]
MTAISHQSANSELRQGNQKIRARHDNVMMPNYAPMEIVPDRGEGAWLWDRDGTRFLDFAAGIAVSALGHAPKVLQEVLADQASRFWHVSNLMTNEPAIELADTLCGLTFAERAFFCNSGAEANEAALKLARRFAFENAGAEKDEIIAFENGFHGRTFFTVCVGGQEKYSNGFGPKPGGISHLPWNDISALEESISDRTCAVILEPVQGEGGVNPADHNFLRAARALCDRHHALLIFDEIQTGIGRSGKLYTYEWSNVVPDILTTAKGLGGGFPVAAMLTTARISESLAVGTHGSTFGGNPLACVVANRVLQELTQTGLLESVTPKSDQLMQGLADLNSRHHMFTEIRGCGLLIGCQLSSTYAGRAGELMKACMDQGLLALVAGPDVLRLAPPLIITEQEISSGLEKIDAAVVSLH